jgi:hypothetical protein
MQSFGDSESGFSVEHDASARIVCVRAWGFWRREVAASFAQAVVAECSALLQPVALLIEVTHLLPQRDEGQAAFGELMQSARALGLAAVAVVVSSTITKMQLLRIAKEGGARDWTYFSTDREAMESLQRAQQARV